MKGEAAEDSRGAPSYEAGCEGDKEEEEEKLLRQAIRLSLLESEDAEGEEEPGAFALSEENDKEEEVADDEELLRQAIALSLED